MKLEHRLQASIGRRSGNVVLRRDLAGLGSPSQISVALKSLQDKGVIERLGSGVYAKTSKGPGVRATSNADGAEVLAAEVFHKLGVASRVEIPAQQSNSAPLKVIVSGQKRLGRKLTFAGRSIVYAKQLKRNRLAGVSLTSVARKVLALAKQHHISYVRTYRDQWAETVTRLAGNEVNSGPIEDLLQALRAADKITRQEMASMLIDHLREAKRVRSI